MENSDTLTIPNLNPPSLSIVTSLGVAILANRNTCDTIKPGLSQYQFWTLIIIHANSITPLLSPHNLINFLNKTSLTSSLVQAFELDNPPVHFG